MTTNPPPNDALIATCHCGRVEVELPSKPAKINECHCTICYKYGVLWGYWKRGDVTVTCRDTKLDKYIRQDEGADGDMAFNRCGHCGCLVCWWGEGEYAGPEHNMGVNCRLLLEKDIEGIEKKVSPGPPKREKDGV